MDPAKGWGQGGRDRAIWREQMANVGTDVSALDRALQDVDAEGVQVYELRMRQTKEGDGFMVIMKARWNGQKVVGFMGGSTPVQALQGAARKLQATTMKWREDRFAGEEPGNVLGEEPGAA